MIIKKFNIQFCQFEFIFKSQNINISKDINIYMWGFFGVFFTKYQRRRPQQGGCWKRPAGGSSDRGSAVRQQFPAARFRLQLM